MKHHGSTLVTVVNENSAPFLGLYEDDDAKDIW
jgi:hypothetical protein